MSFLNAVLRCVLIVMLAVSTTWAAEPEQQLLFNSGRDGYPRFRIPSLIVTPQKEVLAICEGRADGGGLTGNIDIVLRRSSDNGQTWGPIEVIADDGPHTLGNPCPVIDRSTGVIWMGLSRSHGQDTEAQITAGTSRETTRALITSSNDGGKTWSALRDITTAAKSDEWTWFGTGPGVGVQLKSGRLVIPSYHAVKGSPVYRSHMLLSDDHGQTWRRGAPAGEFVGECQIAERDDGTLVMSTRTMKGSDRRTIMTSTDGGLTWSQPSLDRALFDPGCQAMLYRVPDASVVSMTASLWLFSHPTGPKRHNLSVHVSRDEGRSWPHVRRIRTGDGQYSCLAQLPDGSMGCLLDAWVDGNYRVYFTKFSLPWLLAPEDTKSEPTGVAANAARVKQIIAHRGASAEAPENTLASTLRAIASGATAVEVDVRTTRDGHLVLSHDAKVDRTTNGKGVINDLTLDELKQLDAGSWFDPKFNDQRIATLPEVLKVCRGKIDVLLDLKESGDEYVGRVVAAIKTSGEPERTIVGVRSIEQARQFRKLLPQSRQIGLIGKPSEIEAFAQEGVGMIRLWPDWLKTDSSLIDRVRRTEAKLHLNGTTGKLDEVQQLLQGQPDSLSSDDPAELVRSLKKLQVR